MKRSLLYISLIGLFSLSVLSCSDSKFDEDEKIEELSPVAVIPGDSIKPAANNDAIPSNQKDTIKVVNTKPVVPVSTKSTKKVPADTVRVIRAPGVPNPRELDSIKRSRVKERK